MPVEFLDQVPRQSLKEWEEELVELVRTTLKTKRPTGVDTSNTYVRINKARPLRTRHLEITLPHLQDPKASLELACDDDEIEISTHYGDFRWQWDELQLVEGFVSAAIEGSLEYETVYKDGRPKRARAWRVTNDDHQLLGEMLGWRQKPSWANAVRNRPPSFL